MRFFPRLIWTAGLIFAFIRLDFAQTAVWQPVPPSEIESKSPEVEPDADAEVLFWEVRIADKYNGKSGWESVINHHLRIRIFTDRGREANSKVDIPFGNASGVSAKVSIRDIAARTIKPNGAIVELKPEDIFERDIIKGGGVKLKAKSFVPPGIETGAIIEYRWKEVRQDIFNYTRLELAREMPVRYVKYFIKPAGNVPLGFRLHSFNTPGDFIQEKDGFYSTTMKNVPSFREEPRMPSEYNVKPWVLVYYEEENGKPSVEAYWKNRGKVTYETHKGLLKENGEVKKAVGLAIGDAVEPHEKLKRIFEFCRKNLRDIDDDALRLTGELERAGIRENKDTADTLKRGMGNWHDLTMVFAAMANAAGFEARVANAASRRDAYFNPQLANDYFIRTEIVAVKVNGAWKFFDFSSRYLPFGMISWTVEGQAALISDPSEPVWEKVPVSSAEQSQQKRTAKLRLTADGGVEGEVRIEYTGHLADFYREYNDDDAPAEREKFLIETMQRRIGSAAEISAISIENLEEPEKPFVYSFRLRVPAYAERTGKRIFLRPNVFSRSSGALFTSSARRYDVSFEFPWTEEDEITIELPNGFSPESADAPKKISDDKSGARHETKIQFSSDRKQLIYRRSFSFGKAGALLFYEFNYSGVKGLFDAFHTADSHNLILREEASKAN